MLILNIVNLVEIIKVPFSKISHSISVTRTGRHSKHFDFQFYWTKEKKKRLQNFVTFASSIYLLISITSYLCAINNYFRNFILYTFSTY